MKYIHSPSAFENWLSCPRKYRYRAIEKAPTRPSMAHLALGNAVHAVLKDHLFPIDTQQSVSTLLNKHWTDGGYRDQLQINRVKRIAQVWIEQYVENSPEARIRSVEKSIGMSFDTYDVKGRIDRIDEKDNQLVIIDYKVGHEPPTDAQAKSSLALAFYAVAAWRDMKQECFQVELHHIPSGTRAVAIHTSESFQRAKNRMDEIALEINQARDSNQLSDFPAQISNLCGWCEFRPICADGQQAAPEVPSYQGVLFAEEQAIEMFGE
jgi:RecB family exonuclease